MFGKPLLQTPTSVVVKDPRKILADRDSYQQYSTLI
jgi:hypothetical protein